MFFEAAPGQRGRWVPPWRPRLPCITRRLRVVERGPMCHPLVEALHDCRMTCILLGVPDAPPASAARYPMANMVIRRVSSAWKLYLGSFAARPS